MVKVFAVYEGKKRCVAIHEPSQTKLSTDAPKDNNGLGESFSPTDLVGTALVTCTLTTMAIVAERDGVDISGATGEVEKHMSENPRRIAKLLVTIKVPSSVPVEYRKKLEHVARACPVHKSLHPDIEAPIEFIY
ncbi:MAG: OsmC family protein [Bdellovibrionales bacterium]|nr:OsmC family protein [Bdellovibrionales bacterium]